jgi:chromosome segregation ATPase
MQMIATPKTITELEQELSASAARIAALEADHKAAVELAESAEALATQHAARIAELETSAQESASTISALTADLSAATAGIAERDQKITGLSTDLGTASARAEQAENNLARLEGLAGVRGIDSALAIHGKQPACKTISRADFDKLSQEDRSAFFASGGRIEG